MHGLDEQACCEVTNLAGMQEGGIYVSSASRIQALCQHHSDADITSIPLILDLGKRWGEPDSTTGVEEEEALFLAGIALGSSGNTLSDLSAWNEVGTVQGERRDGRGSTNSRERGEEEQIEMGAWSFKRIAPGAETSSPGAENPRKRTSRHLRQQLVDLKRELHALRQVASN